MKFKLLLVLFFSTALITAIFYVFNFGIKKRKISLSEKLAYIKSDFTFAEISITDIKHDWISFRLTVFNQNEESVSELETNLNGRDIFLESRIFVFENGGNLNSLVFPYRLYTEKISPADAVILTNMYISREGISGLYPPLKESGTYSGGMQRDYLFEMIFSGRPDEINRYSIKYGDIFKVFNGKKVFEAALHLGPIKSYQNSRKYRYICHPNGGLEILEDQ